VGDSGKQKIFASKGLVLFRLMFHELPQDASEDKINSFIQLSSAFVKQVYSAKPKEQILVPEASCKATMKHLLEYLYCDKFVEKKLISEVRNVVQLCG